MPFIHIAVLAAVQGLTEFFPVSSSGHLVLVPHVFGWADQGLAMDVAVHVGTLGAVIAYFWRDLWRMAGGLGRLVQGKPNREATLVFYFAAATVPAVIAGLLLHQYMPGGIRSLVVVGWTTLGFGIVLWLADRFSIMVRRIEHMKLFDALVIGLAQAVALIPGTSRSGITMTAARFLGMERHEAARFSMILSIPAIAGAGVLEGWEMIKAGGTPFSPDILMAAGLAFVAGLFAILILMAWLRRASFAPFVVYRIALGSLILALSYGFVPQG